MTKVFIRIQARLNSTRLPGKVLLPINGKPILQHAYERSYKNGFNSKIITSCEESDNPIAAFCESQGIPIFRGSLHDVLSRFYYSLDEATNDDIIVRLTADNIVPDHFLISNMIFFFKKNCLDYLTTTSKNSKFPYGLSIEIFKYQHLVSAFNNAVTDEEKEHVTPWIIQNTNATTYPSYTSTDLSSTRLTIDTLEDYLFVTNLLKEVNLEKADHVSIVSKLSPGTSRLILGTAQLMSNYGISNKVRNHKLRDSLEILALAKKLNIYKLDTARAYINSEYAISKTHHNFSITTKFFPFAENTLKDLNQEVVKDLFIKSAFESLLKLNKTSIESILLHRFEHIHLHGVQEAIKFLLEEGYVKKVGVSIQSQTELEQALSSSTISQIQLPFNIIDNRWSKYFDKLRTTSKEIHVRSCFLQGLLIDETIEWPKNIQKYKKSVMEKINNHKRKYKLTSNIELCLSFILSQEWLDGVVVGIDSPEQLKELVNIEKKATNLTSMEPICFKNDISKLLNPSLWEKS